MVDPIEDLLAQMKAKYGNDEPTGERSAAASAQPTPSSSANSLPSTDPLSSAAPLSSAPADAIDTLLNELTGTAPSPPPASASSFAASVQPNHVESSNQSAVSASSVSASNQFPVADPLLKELKTQYEEQERQEVLKRQEQARIEQQRREKRKRQQRIVAIKPAEEWLKKLDPRSGEAAWFEEFAAKYQSRVEAAIDYLGLVQDE